MLRDIKTKFKKYTALFLACLTATTSVPITSYAIGGNTGAGDQAGIVGGVGSDMGANRPESRIGFRVSLVSKDDPSQVISADSYLTSENLSKLLNVQRVDTSISANGNTSTGNSLYLDSTQSL